MDSKIISQNIVQTLAFLQREQHLTTSKLDNKEEYFSDLWNIANNLFKIIPLQPITNNYLFYYLKDENIQRIIRTSAASSTMPAITHSAIKELKIILPDEKQFFKFDRIAQTIEEQILKKIRKNKLLQDFRTIVLGKMVKVEESAEITL